MDAAPPFSATLDPIAGLPTPLSLYTHDPRVDLVSRRLHEERQWEPFETRLLMACAAPDSVVLDVGANLGYFTVACALAEPAPAAVFAFEPAADNFALLAHNVRRNGCGNRVYAFAAALGESDGELSLHRSDENLGDHQVYAGDGVRQSEAIRMFRGAALLGEYVDRVDTIKIDTQGSESAVIRGLLPLLWRSRPSVRLLIELTPYSLRLAGSSGRGLLTLLRTLNLPFYIVDHVEQVLVETSCKALCTWCDNVDSTEGDRGFMNIFLGYPPPGF